MLANGITLSYKTKGEVYTKLTGLKEVPEMGNDPEKVENTTLEDTTKQYEYGIGDYGDLAYKFKYENKTVASPYRVLRKLADDKTVVDFEQAYPDGTKFKFKAQCSVKLGGGGVNSAMEFTLSLALQSGIAVTDPS
ncbi:phage tail tube protein [Clostridium septicum]|uniref:Phage tail protein n=1 Tax=Clostridium septicum TaxID=1504 RepID=A0A9N7JP85_CLOSE|nr:phage tail tube protein [Clostridium septicum]AYE35694.1 phage tail protein [Clostridium septicum]UEC19630.1 phage tail protein [Clostridium septicum]USS02309.1 phage tail protein [Clostridium septicum]WLF70893.1 phage tail tube protein [Clostridium septicum]